MNLLIDIGNTRIKWATQQGEMLCFGGVLTYPVHDWDQKFSETFKHLKMPDRILVSNVGGEKIAEHFSSWIKNSWKKNPEFAVTKKDAFGIHISYEDISALGVDRWLAMIAARQEFKGPLGIVHCGTCIVVDAIDANGIHRGGFIVPGLELLQSAVITRASGCAHATTNSHPKNLDWANTTDEAIQQGGVLMAVAFIEKMRSKLITEFGLDLNLIISGGDTEYLLPMLAGDYHYRRYLVLQGLSLSEKSN